MASVCQPASDNLKNALVEWAHRRSWPLSIRQLSYCDVPLAIAVEEPARVGMDRLLGALAADRLRNAERAAIVVDLGTAITVDLVEVDGTFAGGTILPGLAMSARALSDHTAALPYVPPESLRPHPAVPGKSTIAAIEAGLYWGATGAIREIVARLSSELAMPPELYFTGGASAQMAELFAGEAIAVKHVPHLVLSGIALAARTIAA